MCECVSAGGVAERPVEHKLSFDASVIARIIGSFDLRRVSRGENTTGCRTHVTPLSEQGQVVESCYRGRSKNFEIDRMRTKPKFHFSSLRNLVQEKL